MAKGSTALNQNVKCPHCKANLAVNGAQGPNYGCPKCEGVFHVQEGGAGDRSLRRN